MQLTFVTSVFLALILPVFVASLVARENCPPPTTCPPEKTCPSTAQFCSKCPRTDNAGHPLQAGAEEAAYTHCAYQDTDCFYGTLSDTPTRLASSYPVGACPTVLGDNVCSDPLPPIGRTLLSTRCPDTNQGAIHTPVRSQPSNSDPSITQCHYANSECYYTTASGLLLEAPSIPKADATYPIPGCRPNLVEEHSQFSS